MAPGWALDASSNAVVGLAVAGDSVYFSAGTSTQPGFRAEPGLYRVRKAGGAPVYLGPHVGPLAVDGTMLVIGGAKVTACALPDCTSPLDLDTTGSRFEQKSVAAAGGTAYWATLNEVRSCPLDGCSMPTVILSSQPNRAVVLATDAMGGLHMLERFGAPELSRWRLHGRRTGGGPIVLLTEGMGGARGLAADADDVYWTTDRGVYRCPKGGCAGAVIELAAGDAYEVRVDGGRVFWVSYPSLAVLACPRDGCGAGPSMALPMVTPLMELDAANLYFATGGWLGRIAK